MTVSARHTFAELEEQSALTRDPKAKLRLRALLLALHGSSAGDIGRRLGVKTQTVAGWVRRYNQSGLASLHDAPRPGRPLRLSAEQLSRFQERVEAGAQPTDGVCSLRGLDLQRILEQEFGVTYSLNGVYWLLHALDYRPLMPRPQHCQSDPQAQEDFKKGSLLCWVKCESSPRGMGSE